MVLTSVNTSRKDRARNISTYDIRFKYRPPFFFAFLVGE